MADQPGLFDNEPDDFPRNGDWEDRAWLRIRMLHDWTGTGEDLRRLLVPLVGEPSDPHHWGKLVKVAKRRRWLVPTGERRPMREPNSHGRMTDVYHSR